jgi:transcriptional regulator with XRE-family HTH domain
LLSETLRKELGRYGLSEKLRALRWQKKMGLVEMARFCGISPALLSKIERHRVVPTLSTLSKIAKACETELSYFFPRPLRVAPTVTRKGERLRFPETPKGKSVAYVFECLNFHAAEPKVNCYLAEFSSPESVRPHLHNGVEFLHVLSGKLNISFSREDHVLESGDSIYFDANLPHSYRRVGNTRCQALVMTLPAEASAVMVPAGRRAVSRVAARIRTA